MSSMRRELLGHRLGLEVVRPHRVDHAQRPALLAGAVVGQHQHQRVRRNWPDVRGSRSAAPMCWSAWSSIAANAACRRVKTRRSSVPRLPTAARRRCAAASAYRPAPAPWPSAAPAAARAPRPSRARRSRRSSRMSSAGAWCGAWQAPGASQVSQGVLGRIGRVVGEYADRLRRPDRRSGGSRWRSVPGASIMRVVAHQLGGVLVGLGIHEAVVAVEAAAQRPAVEGAGRAALRQRRDCHLPSM